MPMVEKKLTSRDKVLGVMPSWKMIYVAPRNFEELKEELGKHRDRLLSVAKHYSETDSDVFALMMFLQADEVGRMLKQKLTRQQKAMFRKCSKILTKETKELQKEAKRRG